MTLLHHALPHYFSEVVRHAHLEGPILYRTSSLDAWPRELVDKPDRFVSKIEACIAHTMTPGHDGHLPTANKGHHHMFLRVTVAPTEGHPEETIFIERVLVQGDETPHAVIPIPEGAEPPYAEGATAEDAVNMFHDHACVILEGAPSALIHAHHVDVARTAEFSRCPDRHLSLYELATLLRFVSAHGLRAVSLGYDTECESYSRWFCRATLRALGEVMRGTFQHWTPPKGEVLTRMEITLFNSIDAWIKSTFRVYPAQRVASENLTRQLNAMNEEERAKKLEQVAKREEELDFKEKVHAEFRRRGLKD